MKLVAVKFNLSGNTHKKGRGKSVSSLPVRTVTFKIQIATYILVDTSNPWAIILKPRMSPAVHDVQPTSFFPPMNTHTSDASLYTFCSKASGDIHRRGLLSTGRSSTIYSLPSKVRANPKSETLTIPLPVRRRLRHARSLCTTSQETTYSCTKEEEIRVA